MSARFYWDDSGAALGAKTVIKNLTGADSTASLELTDLDGHCYGTFVLPSDYALYMRGTTDELQTALKAAIAFGLEELAVESGPMTVRYFRESGTLSTNTKSVVCIAGLENYWSLTVATRGSSLKVGGYAWEEMYTIGPSSEQRYGKYTPHSTITIGALMTKVIPVGKGKSAWYPK